MAVDDAPMMVENLVCFALHAAARASEASYRLVLARFGLTYPQYLVMLVLWERDGVSIGQIGERLYLDSGTLTPLIKRLEHRGLLVRQRDTSDERVVRIHLTGEGRALRPQVGAAVGELVCQLDVGGLDVDALRDNVHRLRLALNRTTAASRPTPVS